MHLFNFQVSRSTRAKSTTKKMLSNNRGCLPPLSLAEYPYKESVTQRYRFGFNDFSFKNWLKMNVAHQHTFVESAFYIEKSTGGPSWEIATVIVFHVP